MNTPYWFSNLAYWSAQVALLVLAAGFLPYIFKIRQPRVLLIYWRALIVVSLLLPFAQPWHQPENFGVINFAPRIGGFAPIVMATSAPATHWHLPSAQIIAEIIGVIILAGIATRFTILALGLIKLRQFRQSSSPISNHAASSAVLDEMRARVNTSGEFRLSSDVASPVTFGLTAPVILLPERFPTLHTQYQSAIACHELIHVRRRDWSHHLSEEILRAALWFHPAIAWLISRVRLSREQVVDLEVIKLTDARKPYLEALLEFTNSRALAPAIPAPPFLVERQLAERVALMLKEVRMSRARLIASLTAIAASLAVVATLVVWTFPLKAAPRISLPTIQSTDKAIIQFVASGVVGGVTHGVQGGVGVGVILSGAPNVTITAVPGGTVGGVTRGVPGGITGNAPVQDVKGGITDSVPAAPQQDETPTRTVALAATKRVPPVYPSEALEKHLEGRVNLALTINSDGKVSYVEVVNGSPQFVRSATDAAFQWEFQQPVKAPAIISARFIFTLSPTRRTPESQALEPRDPPKDPRAVSSVDVEAIVRDPLPQSVATPPAINNSPFVGKFQPIPPATASSEKFQPIPPVTQSMPRGLIFGQPQPETNQGVFLNVAPSNSATSRNPNPQNSSGPVYRAGENGITMPTCKYCPKPEYSDEARDANIQGIAYLQVTVLTTGRAGEIKLTKGLEKSLDEQAIKVVREQWTFKPATNENGDPVNVIVPVEIAFQLYGPPQPTSPPGNSAAAKLAGPPLTPNESLQTKIFTGSVSDKGSSAPSYMGLVNTQTLYAPQPERPRLARQANVQGPVTLNIIVNSEGKVIVAEYVKGPAMLVQSAIDTVRNWIIKGTHDGAPVTFQISVEVSFSDK